MSNNYGQHGAQAGSRLPFIAARYMEQTVTIRRNCDYNLTIASIQTAFNRLQAIPAKHIKVTAHFSGYQGSIQITEDLWAELMPSLTDVTILATQPNVVNAPRFVPAGDLNISILTTTGRLFAIPIQLSDTIDYMKLAIQNQEGTPIENQRLIYAGKQLEDGRTLSDYNLAYGVTIHLACRLRGGKPVIYLFPPVPTTDIRVNLALTKAWDFSAIYPLTPICSAPDGGQSISWIVDAKPNGTLFEHGTRREVSYLFWEAHTKPASPPSPVTSRPGSPVRDFEAAFDPARPIITPANSVVLPFDKVIAYIDDVLLSLGLHTEARCSFITYWLPDLQQHKHVALRFLPQTEYEGAAPMDITPAPDVSTRIFMLFRGVEEVDLDSWAGAVKGVNEWKEVVGVDVGRTMDTGLFRVLEWGGMEVK